EPGGSFIADALILYTQMPHLERQVDPPRRDLLPQKKSNSLSPYGARLRIMKQQQSIADDASAAAVVADQRERLGLLQLRTTVLEANGVARGNRRIWEPQSQEAPRKKCYGVDSVEM
ncbi:hypothetical protein B296_00055138, partial [Ensete ventricosum]